MIQNFKSCGNIILCGEYSLNHGGSGLSLALKKYNTLEFKQAKIFEWLINGKSIDDQWSNIIQENLGIGRGLFNFKIDWDELKCFDYKSSIVSNLCKFHNGDPRYYLKKYNNINFWTSYLNKSIIYSDNSYSFLDERWQFKDQIYFLPLMNENKEPRFCNYQFPTDVLNTYVYRIMRSKTLDEFIAYMDEHDRIISMIIGEKRLKLDNCKYSKYLGVWGGNFALIIGKNIKDYYPEAISYYDLILEK